MRWQCSVMPVTTSDEGSMRAPSDEYGVPCVFRFKRKHDSGPVEEGPSTRKSNEQRHHHRHHHRKHKRRRISDEQSPPSVRANTTSSLPPDAAFRESLFDALADDEGAEFWQSVYGQPIHNYSRTYADAETGELEIMDDEQYAQYVRRKMWEKSAEGLLASREARQREIKEETNRRREQRSEKRKPQEKSQTGNDFVFDFEIEASLRRGQDRKDKKRWQTIWQSYMQRWNELQQIYESRKGSSADDGEQIFLRNKIAWPVESGKRKDVDPDAVEAFFQKVCDVQQVDEHNNTTSIATIVKAERVKWHPDKIQQKFGFMQIEQGTMEGVTAVFQVLDRMWTILRTSKQ